MRTGIGFVLVVWALAAPTRAVAQGTAAVDTTAYRLGPIELLLEYRDSLHLSTMQLQQLHRLRADLAARNEPLIAWMVDFRRVWQRERSAARRGGADVETERLRLMRAEAEPVHARIDENNRAAMQEINRMLTAEQRAHLRAIVRARGRVAPDRRAPFDR